MFAVPIFYLYLAALLCSPLRSFVSILLILLLIREDSFWFKVAWPPTVSGIFLHEPAALNTVELEIEPEFMAYQSILCYVRTIFQIR